MDSAQRPTDSAKRMVDSTQHHNVSAALEDRLQDKPPEPLDSTQRRIVKAATELFAERGFRATTTRAIAERADVNEVTLFRRFGTKSGVLRAVGETLAAAQAGHTPALDSGDVVADLTTLAQAEIASAREFGPLMIRLVLESGDDADLTGWLAAGARANAIALQAKFHTWQAAGLLRNDVPAELLTQAFFGLTSQVVMSGFLGATKETTDDDVTVLLTVLLDGILPAGASR